MFKTSYMSYVCNVVMDMNMIVIVFRYAIKIFANSSLVCGIVLMSCTINNMKLHIVG